MPRMTVASLHKEITTFREDTAAKLSVLSSNQAQSNTLIARLMAALERNEIPVDDETVNQVNALNNDLSPTEGDEVE